MGMLTQAVRRPYAPPSEGVDASGNSSNQTFLGAGDPNLVRVSGGMTPSDPQLAQQPPARPVLANDPSNATATGALSGRDASNLYLKFDGRYLRLYDRDTPIAEWPGVSGKENFGSGKNQKEPNYGPIPEGTYDIKQSRYETINLRNKLLGVVGRGEWPGSVRGWGTERVWADPTPETVRNGLTFGRKDMAIHAGWSPGSAGCIDLTGNMENFAQTFRGLGRDLKLYVDYSRPVPP